MHSQANVVRRVAMAEKPITAGPNKDGAGEKAAEYRRKAQAHTREATLAPSPEMRELQLRLAKSYEALAENEEWLEGRTTPYGSGDGAVS
jgi:hypothetical protein